MPTRETEPVPSRKIRRALVRAVAVPCALLFVLAASFIFQTDHLLQLSSYVEHTEHVLRESYETQKLIIDMETGLRGYAINKDAIFLTPYLEARDQIDAHLRALNRLVADNPRDVRRMAEILILTDEWRRIAEKRFKEGTMLEGPPTREVARAAKARMDRIRVNFARIARDAENLRNERRTRIEAAVRRGLRLGISLALGLGLLVGFSTFRQIRSITRTFLENLRMLREAQSELRRSYELLEEKVEARTRSLTEANRELDAFAYSVSHDLRAPLRGIDGFALALEEDCGPRLGPDGLRYVGFIRKSTARMSRLIEDLLALSRLAREDLALRPVDLSRIAGQVADELRRSQPNRAVTFTIAPGLAAEADAGLVTIAFENLLGNAWKFTARRPDACIGVDAVVLDGETVFRVRDNGAGFDMGFAQKLFGPFQRLHSESEFEGTGVGLATVRRIVNRHGGRIWAEAIPGAGAVFSFTLAPKRTG